jgi:CPA2 family monovalent cation:H+ antiporter-2
MSDAGVLQQLLIVLSATIAIVFLFHKLRLPTIVGFLLAGVVIGPHGWRLIADAHQVETLAGIGVVLLLFTIGLEFSLGQLLAARRSLVRAGVLQILLTVAAVLLFSTLAGYEFEMAVFYGFLVSLSSTAIVLKIYSDGGEIDSLPGRLATGILLFQDLCLVPMMLLVPVLSRSSRISLALVAWALLKAVSVLLLILWGARSVLPWLLRQAALLRNRELFILFIVLVCLGTAWLTSELGLSLAVGAFMAGLVISESEFSHQVVADILPLRDCFSGIFFISIGMLLDLGFLARDPAAPLINLLLIVSIKAVVVFFIFWRLYRSVRLGIVLGFSLAQVGEFSFILADVGRGHGLLTAGGEQAFLAASILSMFATPFLISGGRRLAFRVEGMVGTQPDRLPQQTAGQDSNPMRGHVIVVGFGLNGRNLTRVLKEVSIPYVVLEMDPDLVDGARVGGEAVLFGDGTRPEVLRKAGIDQARVLVIAISDPVASARIVSQSRSMNPELHVVVRTRYVAEIEHLYQLGADQVIPEEFETSVEIFARVLQEYHIPRNVIALQVDLIRKERYGMLRGLHLQGKSLDRLSQFLAGTTTDTFLVLQDSPAVGRSLAELQLRARSGVTVIAVVRNETSIHSPGPEFVLETGDILVLVGNHKALDRANRLLNPPDRSVES